MKRVAKFVGIGVCGLALIYLVVAFLTSRAALAGTSIAGVDVAGKSVEEIPGVLEEALKEKSDEDIAIKVESGNGDTKVSPEDAGVGVDYEASAQKVAGFTLNPVTLYERFNNRTDQPPELKVDDSRLTTSAGAVAKNLEKEPESATLAFERKSVKLTPSKDGTKVDPELVVQGIREQWLVDDAVTVKDEVNHPDFTTEDAEKVKREVAEPALKDDVTLNVEGDVEEGKELTVTPEAIAKHGSFNESGELVFDERFRTTVMNDNLDVGEAGRDASFEFVDGKPKVVPSRDGVSVNKDELAKAVRDAIGADDRSAAITLGAEPADFSTEDAEKLDLSDTISDFAIPYSSSPARDTNLKVSTRAVSGTVLQPGEQFSLNKTLGPRTASAGYKQAGVISGGQMKKDFGGGVSQVSTTLFNAAFFAGFDLDEHKAHSRYISRYPEGRETTLDYRSIDLKFTNNTDKPVVLDMYLKGGKVHARVLGVKTVDVEADASSRFAYTSPSTIKGSGSTCKPQSPRQGWSIKIFRTIKEHGSGKVIKKDDFVTVYNPVHRVTCS